MPPLGTPGGPLKQLRGACEQLPLTAKRLRGQACIRTAASGPLHLGAVSRSVASVPSEMAL